MKFKILIVVWWCSAGWLPAHATSLGRMEYADIESVDGKPSICIPGNAEKSFSVGWVSLSQSYTKNTGFWGVSLKSGEEPLMLKPGECFVFGVVPNGYASEFPGSKEYPLRLEVNQTYVFRLSGAYKSTDTYRVVFCVNSKAGGGFEYLKYIPLSGGEEAVPVCNVRSNSGGPE